MSHKPTGKGPTYGDFCFAKGGTVYVKGYVRGGKVSQPKVEKVMHEFGAGDLHSGSKSGPVVKNRKQAVAIALSEAKKAPVKMAQGGLAKRAEAMASPKITGMPPKDMNVKARYVPRMADGGMAHPDAKQDKALIKKAIRQHDTNLHGGAKETITLKKGGKLRK